MNFLDGSGYGVLVVNMTGCEATADIGVDAMVKDKGYIT
jgi:hypothetical protein